MKVDMQEKCYSVDEEFFSTDFPGSMEVNDIYWEADAIPAKVSHYVTQHFINNLLDALDDATEDDVPEEIWGINSFYDVPDEAKQELKDLIIQWAEKHVKLKHYEVRNAVQKVYEG